MVDRLNYLQDMLKQEPNDPFLIYALALEFHKKGDISTCILNLEKLVIVHPDYLATYYQLGKCYEEQQKVHEAREAFEKGIIIAQKQKNNKTLGELRTALDMLDE